ncbi:hypothetical protein COW46_04645 [Candidatus Gracilibacteria bacterium CG17_big_fil_post_rev_8_21_14_2_50_48_13]|nr:MAG: hypothetical protein COW46_04645 [Candidatus Gracilibacteria bacterium CG17_big_fil_post_rev_8_21_14_2_50_48_13]
MSTLHTFLNPENSPLYKALKSLLPKNLDVSDEDIHLAERLESSPEARTILQNTVGTNKSAEEILQGLGDVVHILPDILEKLGAKDLLTKRSSKALVSLSLLLGLTACGTQGQSPTAAGALNSYAPATAPAIVPDRLSELEAEVEALKTAQRESSTALKKEIDTVHNSIQSTTGQLSSISSNLTKVASLAQSATAEVRAVKSQISNTNAALNQTMEEISKQNAMLADVQSGLGSVTESNAMLSSALEETQSAVRNTQIATGNLSEALYASRVENANVAQELQGLQNSVQKTSAVVNGVQQTVVNEADRYLASPDRTYLGYMTVYADSGLHDLTIRFQHENIGSPYLYVSKDGSAWRVDGQKQADGSYIFTFPFEGYSVGNNQFAYGISVNTGNIDLFSELPEEQRVMDIPYQLISTGFQNGDQISYYIDGVGKIKR